MFIRMQKSWNNYIGIIQPWATCGPLFKLFNVTLLKPQEYAYFIEKSTKSLENFQILALDMVV